MTQEEQNLSEICKFIILNLSSIRVIDSSYRFRKEDVGRTSDKN